MHHLPLQENLNFRLIVFSVFAQVKYIITTVVCHFDSDLQM